MRVAFGIDQFISSAKREKYGRIGLVTNDAAYTTKHEKSRTALLQAGFSVTKLFSPEHGISARGADGAFMPDGCDILTGLPIISLYGEKLAPSGADMEDIDTVLFDIPDIGLRYYTYLWTMTYVLEACADWNKKLVILDRPNPLGSVMEGPMLDEEYCSSFIGRWSLPARHGCTLGELASYFNTTRSLYAELEVIPCTNWCRDMSHTEWGLAFEATSPAICSDESLLAYPVTVFAEATNLSEGRGTEAPFARIGAPWLRQPDLNLLLPFLQGIEFNECRFTPSEGKFNGILCEGLEIRITDPKLYQPVITGLLLFKLIKDQYRDYFAWNPYPTRANPEGSRHLDLLTGVADSETLFELPFDIFLAQVIQLTQVNEFSEDIHPFLIYD